MGIFDSHAHYDDAAFDSDREELLQKLPSLGVDFIINAGASLRGSYESVALSEKFRFIYAAAGIHPEYAADVTESDFSEIQKLLLQPKTVAVGEIGLDYHYEDGAPREKQISVFKRQIEMALQLDLPVIVHDRDAHEDTFSILREYKPKGVVHCFSGSAELMREAVSIGMYIGLGGAVTFKNAKKAVKVAAEVPTNRLLLETDCPYMAPEPYRGERNNSSYIKFVAEKIAEIKDMSAAELIEKCKENTKTLFNI